MGMFPIHNTPLWMNTHQEYASLKSCQEKTQREKKSMVKEKKVQYSCVSLSSFRIALLKPCKGKPYRKKP